MTSKTTILAVVIGLIVIVVGCLASAVVLIALGLVVPGFIGNIALTGTGGLIGLLASTRGTLSVADVEPTMVPGLQAIAPASPQPVAVVNPPDEPVPAVLVDDGPVPKPPVPAAL